MYYEVRKSTSIRLSNSKCTHALLAIRTNQIVWVWFKRLVLGDTGHNDKKVTTVSMNLVHNIKRTTLSLGDNCIQICHLGKYIVGYTVGNFVLRRRVSDDIPPQMTNWNMVIPMLMYLLTFTHKNQVFASKTLAA